MFKSGTNQNLKSRKKKSQHAFNRADRMRFITEFDFIECQKFFMPIDIGLIDTLQKLKDQLL